MGPDSFGAVGFDLGPLLQGQMRIAKINDAYISFICVPRGLQCHPAIGLVSVCYSLILGSDIT